MLHPPPARTEVKSCHLRAIHNLPLAYASASTASRNLSLTQSTPRQARILPLPFHHSKKPNINSLSTPPACLKYSAANRVRTGSEVVPSASYPLVISKPSAPHHQLPHSRLYNMWSCSPVLIFLGSMDRVLCRRSPSPSHPTNPLLPLSISPFSPTRKHTRYTRDTRHSFTSTNAQRAGLINKHCIVRKGQFCHD